MLVIGVLVLVWRREAKRADRNEQATLTALRAVDQLAANTTALIGTVQRIAEVVDGWDTTGGRHRRPDGSEG